MLTVTDIAVLDNPAYAALTGPQAQLALSSGRALRFPDDVSPFMALPADATAQDWNDARRLVPENSAVGVLNPGDRLPDGWRAMYTMDGVQMIAVEPSPAPEPEAVELKAADVPEMLELIERTQPGPFLQRTIELGTYLGIRRDGALVAIAGERLHPTGWTEISAVCTAPEHQGHGYASRLIRALFVGIEARGELPFLHTLKTNMTAIRLYEQLGFELRRELSIVVLTPQHQG